MSRKSWRSGAQRVRRWVMRAAGRAALCTSVAASIAAATLFGAAEGHALPARLSADLPAAGTWNVGVFSPLRWVVRDGLELETHPLITLVAPHLTARVRHVRSDAVRITGEYGLGLPTTAFALSPPGVAGYLGPSCKVRDAEPDRAPASCERPGAVLTLSAGVLASIGSEAVTTGKLDATYGVALGDTRGRPADTWPILDNQLAPIFRAWRAHAMVRHDRPLHERVRVSGELHVWQVGRVDTDSDDRSLTTFGAHVGLDIGLGAHSRATIGALYTNADTRATEVVDDDDGFSKRVFVRSHDVWPTLDVLWTF